MNAAAWPDVVEYVGGFAALLVALGVIAKSRVGKAVAWCYRRLFGDPITQWAHSTITTAVTPHLDALRRENTAQHAEGKERLAGVEKRLGEQISPFAQEIKDHATRITALETRRKSRTKEAA